MNRLLCGLGGFFLYAVLLSVFVSGTLGDPTEVCQPRNVSYKISDSKQCDKYHECVKSGKLLERLCDDGFVFSEEIHMCEYPHNVDCSKRPGLQPSLSTNPDCPRMNGFYPFPPADSCQKFHHCLEGKAYEKTCPEGVIFDPSKGTCVHPDLSHRTDCAAKTVLNLTCPNSGKRFGRLRFGDHDRLPHTTNCRKFFICFGDGTPRVGGCPLGKVFNPKLGMCDSPKKVPECRDYYGKKDLDKLAKLAEQGEEGALEEDLIHSVPDADEQEEDPSTNEAGFEQQVESPPQPQSQSQETSSSSQKSKSKGKKFQGVSKRQAPLVSPSASNQSQADDNSSPASGSTSQTNKQDKKKQGKKEDSDSEEDD